MHNLLDKYRWQGLICIDLLLGIIFPFFIKWVGIDKAWRFGLIFIVINCLWSIVIGNIIKPLPHSWLWLFVWPLIYMVGNWLFYPKYAYLFAIVYLGASYIAYGREKG
ncbi:hypothetical protein [Secundilactobacillus malefermentans]|uniref:hypothetical protein n=1 Tax=Secundilactobacillus malefermentans TaxID=176292 RepID=UPI0011CC58B4|nr:hypothetical protein [Secundilactobacillus malefermentans]QEA32293.1 hypothetical protein FGL90_08965 [Secundilactobacillus malefermentans]